MNFRNKAALALVIVSLVFAASICACSKTKMVKGAPSEVIEQCNALDSTDDVRVEVSGFATNMTLSGGIVYLYDTDEYSSIYAGVADYKVMCMFDEDQAVRPGDKVTIEGDLYAGSDGMLLTNDEVMLMNCEIKQ